MLDGKQATSDTFSEPDKEYCIYDSAEAFPFRFISNEDNADMDMAWNNKSWRLRKYIPDDKELVWCWDDNNETKSLVAYYDAKNNCIYTSDGRRNGVTYNNYAPFDGTLSPNMCKIEDLED